MEKSSVDTGTSYLSAVPIEKLIELSESNSSTTNSDKETKVSKNSKTFKMKKKVGKKRNKTLLEMMENSDSDSGDEKLMIDDNSGKTILKSNSELRVSETSFTSDEEIEDDGNLCGYDKELNLAAEAKDVEEMVKALDEKNHLSRKTLIKLNKLHVQLRHTVPPQHMVETCAGSRGPTKEQREIIEKLGPIKYGKFTPEEDETIMKNWKSFCKLHDWDPKDYRPFLYMRHQHDGMIIKFSERQKFVQFLADGLPWRTLYSVYWRFRNLSQRHVQTRYTENEDKLIIAHMENSLAMSSKNVRKFAELAKVLNRTRASVWRRYRLLSKKRKPNKILEWNLSLVKRFIKYLMHLTLSDDIKELKDLDIPLVIWKKLSKELNIDNRCLREFWLKKLHMQLFCEEPIYMNDIKIKLIEYFYVTGTSDRCEIDWPTVAKHFDGLTPTFLYQLFHILINNKRFEHLELVEIVEYLYEVQKPKLQQAPTDKCLPRIIYNNGDVKILDSESDDEMKS